MSSKSAKTAVIEDIFLSRAVGGVLPAGKEVVTLDDVQAAIHANNSKAGRPKLSTRNPANFMKDIVRSNTRNEVFPGSVADEGYTARQATGNDNCFRFVPFGAPHTVPFPVIEPQPWMVAEPHPVQSLTLVAGGRRYGRSDESWLIAVATSLGLVQTHLALHNTFDLLGMALVAPHVKLQLGEVDALYHAEDSVGNRFVVACEAKGEAEVFDEFQIERVAEAVAKAPATKDAAVIPLGIKKVAPKAAAGVGGLVWIRAYDTSFPPLRLVSERVYDLKPAVPGIG